MNGKYRVWCLSWEDDESHGKEYADRPSGWFDPDPDPNCERWALNARDAVRRYAEHCHNNRDGWEETWPLMFRVRMLDGTTCDYEVEREMVPNFVVESDRSRERREATP